MERINFYNFVILQKQKINFSLCYFSIGKIGNKPYTRKLNIFQRIRLEQLPMSNWWNELK